MPVWLLICWFQAKGGSLAFLPANPSFDEIKAMDGEKPSLLVYVNGDHEYIIFDPHNMDNRIGKSSRTSQIALEEAGKSHDGISRQHHVL